MKMKEYFEAQTAAITQQNVRITRLEKAAKEILTHFKTPQKADTGIVAAGKSSSPQTPTSQPHVPITQQPQQQGGMDMQTLLYMSKLLGGGEDDNSMNKFFSDFGKEMFFNVARRMLPSGKALKKF